MKNSTAGVGDGTDESASESPAPGPPTWKLGCLAPLVALAAFGVAATLLTGLPTLSPFLSFAIMAFFAGCAVAALSPDLPWRWRVGPATFLALFCLLAFLGAFMVAQGSGSSQDPPVGAMFGGIVTGGSAGLLLTPRSRNAWVRLLPMSLLLLLGALLAVM